MDDGGARNGWTTVGAVGGTRVTPASAPAATAGSRHGSGSPEGPDSRCGALAGAGTGVFRSLRFPACLWRTILTGHLESRRLNQEVGWED